MSSAVDRGLSLRWQRRPSRRGRRLARAGIVLLLLGGACTLAAVGVAKPSTELSQLLDAGCEDVEPCRTLEAAAAERLEQCWLSCNGAREQEQAARLLLYRAEERRRVRDHYRQSDALEGRLAQGERERRLADEQRVLSAQAALEERRYQRQLEDEQSQRVRDEQRLAEQRAKELQYLTLLSPSGRVLRLRRCHERWESCDALIERLIEASPTEKERHSLADLNERLLADKELPKQPASAEPATSPPASARPAAPDLAASVLPADSCSDAADPSPGHAACAGS